MYFAVSCFCIFNVFCKFGKGAQVSLIPTFSALSFKRGNGTCPNYIFNLHIIAEYNFFTGINIDYGCKTGFVNTKEIKEGTVLAEMINVLRVIHRQFGIA